MAIRQEKEVVMERAGDGSWLALWDYQIRLAKGETTGNRLVDYLFFSSHGVEDFHEREQKLESIIKKLEEHVGEEILVGYRGAGHTGHRYPGTFLGSYEYDEFYLARIVNTPYEVEMRVYNVPDFKEDKSWVDGRERASADLFLPVRGYVIMSGNIDREEGFVKEPLTFPEYARTLAIGKDEVLVWRGSAPGHEKSYQRMSEQLREGLASL